jgi:hypothetical protein
MLYVRHIEDDVCREDGLRTVDLEEGWKAHNQANLSLETRNHVRKLS